MASRSSISGKIVSLVFSLILILSVSLLFGQVLGNLYLENLGGGQIEPGNAGSGVRSERTKVLRLKELTYYTIEAAAYQERESALSLGNLLASKGLPVVIVGTSPSQVRLGFLNNEEKLAALAQTIIVDGKKAVVVRQSINAVSFKFAAGDSFSGQVVAPFLGELSITLEKALLLNMDLDCSASQFQVLKPKFGELAANVEVLSSQCLAAAGQDKESPHSPYLVSLAAALHNWNQSLSKLAVNWDNAHLLASQQQALVVVEEYLSLLNSTN